MNLLLQDDWLDYNHLYVFGKTLHQQEYQILQKGFEIGLSKTQIANIFSNQGEFVKINNKNNKNNNNNDYNDDNYKLGKTHRSSPDDDDHDDDDDNDLITPTDVIASYTGERKGDIKAEFFDDCASIPDPAELCTEDKNLIILDDCFLDPQNKAEAYYTRGRHNNCDTFYISQSNFRLPRHTVRENSNFFILFPQDAKISLTSIKIIAREI